MTRCNQAQDAVSKLELAVHLLKRLDNEGVRETFPDTCEVLDGRRGRTTVTSYVGRYDGTPAEYAAGPTTQQAGGIPSSAFAFAIPVRGCGEDSTDDEIAEAIRKGIHERIISLCKVDRTEQAAGAA